MTEYGTLNNGRLAHAPNPIFIDGKMVFNPANEVYEALGYLPINRTPSPDNGKHYVATWEVVDGVICRVWMEAEFPDLATEAAYLACLERFGVV